MAWLNADGLYLPFGREHANAGRVGEYNTLGPDRTVEINVYLPDLSASAQTVLSPTVTLPEGAVVLNTEVIVTAVTDSTNDTANLDLGFQKLDGTEYDYDGLLDAADVWHAAAIGTSTVYVAGTTEAGNDYGVALTEPVRLVAKADTEAYTAGSLAIRITYISPVVAPDL